MKRLAVLMLLCAMIVPSLAWSAEFSLYGVKMGTPRAELATIWKRLENGEYTIPGTSVFNIKTEFDHRDRLYILSFSVPIGDQYPSGLMSTAFQRLVDEMWKGDPDNSISTRASRGVVEVNVGSRKFQEEYIEHIKIQLAPLLKP